MAALPFNCFGAAVRKQLPVIWSLLFSAGSSVCTRVVAVLWAVDCSAQSPRVFGEEPALDKLPWSGKGSLSWHGLKKSWHLEQSQLSYEKICLSWRVLAFTCKKSLFSLQMSLVLFSYVPPWF